MENILDTKTKFLSKIKILFKSLILGAKRNFWTKKFLQKPKFWLKQKLLKKK